MGRVERIKLTEVPRYRVGYISKPWGVFPFVSSFISSCLDNGETLAARIVKELLRWCLMTTTMAPPDGEPTLDARSTTSPDSLLDLLSGPFSPLHVVMDQNIRRGSHRLLFTGHGCLLSKKVMAWHGCSLYPDILARYLPTSHLSS